MYLKKNCLYSAYSIELKLPSTMILIKDLAYYTWADCQGLDYPLVPTNSSCNTLLACSGRVEIVMYYIKN